GVFARMLPKVFPDSVFATVAQLFRQIKEKINSRKICSGGKQRRKPIMYATGRVLQSQIEHTARTNNTEAPQGVHAGSDSNSDLKCEPGFSELRPRRYDGCALM